MPSWQVRPEVASWGSFSTDSTDGGTPDSSTHAPPTTYALSSLVDAVNGGRHLALPLSMARMIVRLLRRMLQRRPYMEYDPEGLAAEARLLAKGG